MDNKKKRNVLFLVGLLVCCFFIIGVSYAVWQLTLIQTDSNIVTTGCFKVEFTDQNPINLEKAYPITDEEGKGFTPYEFTITNTCEDNALYQINLEILNDSTLTDLNFIKMSLNESTKNIKPILLTSNDPTPKTLENASSSYQLSSGYLKSNDVKTYHLRLWLDNDTPPDDAYMNKTFQSKITVVTSYIEADEELPVASFTVTKNETGVVVDASSSTDNKGITKYYYSVDGENFISSATSTHTFIEERPQYDNAVEMITKLNAKELKKVYVKVEDAAGNVSKIKSINIGNLIYDETTDNNLRYIGKNPNNYIDIGDKDAEGNTIPWRIIGVMNNIDDGTGNKETRIKIIRKDGIGKYSWDTSSTRINGGTGINEWTNADIMKLLNSGHEMESVGGSLYWNRRNGTCYNGFNLATTNCEFSSIGLNDEAKEHIKEALWHTGSNGNISSYDNILVNRFYELERSNNTGKVCTSGDYCNDTVARTTTWLGRVGLMYPSDYGYATGGGISTKRETCLNTILYHWNDLAEECKNNNWLYDASQWQWTLMPRAYSSHALDVIRVVDTGNIGSYSAAEAGQIRPTLYLLSSTKIIDGDGSIDHMYQIQG